MDTETYCQNLNNLNKKDAIQAIHQAYLQLKAIGPIVNVEGLQYDNRPALKQLQECLKNAGHIGFEFID